jgi:hypothetical protein
MAEIPLIAPTLLVLVCAALEWGGLRRIAWAALVAGGVLLTAAIAYPGQSASEILDGSDRLLAYALIAARGVGVACFVACAARRVQAAL